MQEAGEAEVAHRRPRPWWGTFIAPAIFAAGLLVTLAAWQVNRNDHGEILATRFSRETDRIAVRMAEEVRDLVSYGRAAQAALGGDSQVDGNVWTRFLLAIDFERNNPALRAIAYVERREESERERHIVQLANALFDGQALSLNSDLMATKSWPSAANWAAEEGFFFHFDDTEPSNTQRLIFPLFETDQIPGTLEERRSAVKGWMVIDFDMAELFAGVMGQSEGVIRLIIKLENGKSLRLDSSNRNDTTSLMQEVSFYWVGLKASLLFSAFPEFERVQTAGDSYAIIPAGIAISVLLAVAAYQLLNGREEAFLLAQTLSQEARDAAESARVAWQHLSDAIEAIPEGFVLWDSNDRLLLCNSRYREMYSRIADRLVIGTPFTEIARAALERGQHTVPEDQRQEWYTQRVERHRSSTSAFEQHMSDGRWILVSECQTQDGGIVGIRADITAIKKAQAQLVQASKLATLGEMATGIAHELNQPLTIMRMAAESAKAILHRKGAEGIPAVLEKQDKILRQIDRAATNTNHMRTFGRESSDQNQRVDMARVVEETLGMIGEQLRNHGIEITTTVEPGLYVHGNAIRLEQVLLNLLGNARDAVETRAKELPGSMVVGVSGRYDNSKNCVEVVIADNGGGIRSDILDRIFDPFFTTKEPGKGTGLGLSISYGIVNEMGGQLTARNARDGAVFSLTLPCVGREA